MSNHLSLFNRHDIEMNIALKQIFSGFSQKKSGELRCRSDSTFRNSMNEIEKTQRTKVLQEMEDKKKESATQELTFDKVPALKNSEKKIETLMPISREESNEIATFTFKTEGSNILTTVTSLGGTEKNQVVDMHNMVGNTEDNEIAGSINSLKSPDMLLILAVDSYQKTAISNSQSPSPSTSEELAFNIEKKLLVGQDNLELSELITRQNISLEKGMKKSLSTNSSNFSSSSIGNSFSALPINNKETVNLASRVWVPTEVFSQQSNEISFMLLSKAGTMESQTLPSSPMWPSFSDAKWGEAIAEKVIWMSAKGMKEVNIQLNPSELGQVSIKISMSQEQAQVNFTVQHSSVREALDQQSLKLKEMLAEEGINLSDLDVSDQSQAKKDQQKKYRSNGERSANEEEVAVVPIYTTATHYNLIDSYV